MQRSAIRRLALRLVFATICLSGCASFVSPPSPRVDAPSAFELGEPPPMLINGVEGKPVSWCLANGCVDGFVNSPLLLDEVTAPFDIQLPAGAHIERASARGAGLPGDQARFEIPWTANAIGAAPDGAVILDVFVRFADGGDASYAWALHD